MNGRPRPTFPMLHHPPRNPFIALAPKVTAPSHGNRITPIHNEPTPSPNAPPGLPKCIGHLCTYCHFPGGCHPGIPICRRLATVLLPVSFPLISLPHHLRSSSLPRLATPTFASSRMTFHSVPLSHSCSVPRRTPATCDTQLCIPPHLLLRFQTFFLGLSLNPWVIFWCPFFPLQTAHGQQPKNKRCL